MDAVLPIYKPVGITSYDVIREWKRAQNPPTLSGASAGKVGHGGTLDPFADGVLLLLLGKATKKMNELSALPKTYRAVAILEASSDTLDKTGIITPFEHQTIKTLEEIESASEKFVGEIEQEIPDYSATKINGVPRYKLARAGKEMEKKSKKVMIYDLRILKLENNKVEFETTVSSGTYIRQLSYDLFKSLGTESYLDQLTRTKIGEYTIDKCANLEDFSSSMWQDKAEQIVPPAHGE